MVAAVKWAGNSSSRSRVVGPLSNGSSATTIGMSRTLLSPTASATSIAAAPAPSAVIRIT
jgi:hypothetical protein